MKSFLNLIYKLILVIIAIFINAIELFILACCWCGYNISSLLYKVFLKIYEIVKNLLDKFNPVEVAKK